MNKRATYCQKVDYFTIRSLFMSTVHRQVESPIIRYRRD